MSTKDDFIRQQYTQYHETRRQINSFSWQVPSVAVLAVLFFTGLDPEKLKVWQELPVIPAIGFLVLGVFMVVLLVFHVRNISFLRNFETVLSELENHCGAPLAVYAHQVDPKFRLKTHSSRLLAWFLGFLSVLAFGLGGYFWWVMFTK